jgi:hypothetical protein
MSTKRKPKWHERKYLKRLDRINRRREAEADAAYAARQNRPRYKWSRGDRLRWQLTKLRLPRALDSVLQSLLREHQGDSDYGVVSAFVDVLSTLKPSCDAVADARWFGSKAGIAVDRLQSREDLLAWLQEGASTRASSPQEPVSEGGGHVATPHRQISGRRAAGRNKIPKNARRVSAARPDIRVGGDDAAIKDR